MLTTKKCSPCSMSPTTSLIMSLFSLIWTMQHSSRWFHIFNLFPSIFHPWSVLVIRKKKSKKTHRNLIVSFTCSGPKASSGSPWHKVQVSHHGIWSPSHMGPACFSNLTVHCSTHSGIYDSFPQSRSLSTRISITQGSCKKMSVPLNQNQQVQETISVLTTAEVTHLEPPCSFPRVSLAIPPSWLPPFEALFP